MTTNEKLKHIPERPYCKECGSENLAFEGTISWDNEIQQFVVDSIMDKGHYCEDCDGEASYVFRTEEQNNEFKKSKGQKP